MKAKLVLIVLPLTLSAATIVNTGQTVTMKVTADGTAPFSYKWSKDGTDIAGATTDTLLLSNVAASASGNYVATVTNTAGAASSAPASLVVTTTATTTAFARVDMTLPWTPAQQQFLTVVCNSAAEDPGSHYNVSTGIYTVGPNEGGRYRIMINARPDDTATPLVSFGLGAGTVNSDMASVGWKSTNQSTPGIWMRNGAQHVIEATYNAGDQLRAFVYTQAPIKFVGFEVIFEKVN